MKVKIEKFLPFHTIQEVESPILYVADYKNSCCGKVQILSVEPADIKYVCINNPNQTKILFDGFDDNALPIKKGSFSKQCECVLFPSTCLQDDWVLFIETKYSFDLRTAFDENNDYPHCMINQVIETVKYFRDKGILEPNRRVNAIVSFPNLIEDFSGTFFTGNISEIDILTRYKILMRATNSATVISNKRINLGSRQ
jgi:hypothetical protein